MSGQTDPLPSHKRPLQLQTVDSSSSSISIGSTPIPLADSPASASKKQKQHQLQQPQALVQNLNNNSNHSNVVYPTMTSLSMGAPRNLSLHSPSSTSSFSRPLLQRPSLDQSQTQRMTAASTTNTAAAPNVVVATATQEPKRVRVYLSDQFHQLANLLGIDGKERSDVLSSAVEKLAHFQLQQEQRMDSTNLIHGFPSLFSCVNIENIPTCYLTLAGKFCDANKAFLQTFHFPLHSNSAGTTSRSKQNKHVASNNHTTCVNHVSPPTPNSVLSSTATSPAHTVVVSGTASSTSTASLSTTPPSANTPLNSLQSQYDFNVLRRHSFASLVTPTDGPKLARILSSLLNDQMSTVPSTLATSSRSSSNHSLALSNFSHLQQHTIDSQSLCLTDLNQGSSQRYTCVFNALKTRGVLKLLMVMCIPERNNSQNAELSPTAQGTSPTSFALTPYSTLLSDTKVLPSTVSVTPNPTPASAPTDLFLRTQSAPTGYHPYVTSVAPPANLTPTKLGPGPMYQQMAPPQPPVPPPPPQSAPVPLMSMNAWSPHSSTTVFDYSQQPQQPQQPPQPPEAPKMQPVPQPVYSTYPTPTAAPLAFQPPPQHPLSNVTFATTTPPMPPAYPNSTTPAMNYSPVTSNSLPFASASPSRTSPQPNSVSQSQLDDIHHQLAIIQQQQAMLMASSQQLQHQQQQHQLQRQQLEQHIQLQQHQLVQQQQAHHQQHAHQQVVQQVQVVRPAVSHLASLAYAANMPPPPSTNVAVKIEPLHPPSPTVSTPSSTSED